MVSLSDITIKSFGQRFMDERVQSFSNGSHKIVNRLSPLQLIDDGRELQCCLDSPTLVSDSARINVIASCKYYVILVCMHLHCLFDDFESNTILFKHAKCTGNYFLYSSHS